MSVLRRILIIPALIAVACTLSACEDTGNATPAVGTSANPAAANLYWYNTEVGAVQCLTANSASGYDTTSCNWQGLLAGKQKADVQTLDGRWVSTKLGRMYCITNYTKYGYHQYDCDWAHVTKKPLTTSQ